MSTFKFFVPLLCIPFALGQEASSQGSYGVPAKEIRFAVLDKTTAKSKVFKLLLGEHIELMGLTIRVVRIWKVLDPSITETLGFFEVFEGKGMKRSELIFSGWISSTHPGCSCLEHPRYNIAVLEACYDS